MQKKKIGPLSYITQKINSKGIKNLKNMAQNYKTPGRKRRWKAP